MFAERPTASAAPCFLQGSESLAVNAQRLRTVLSVQRQRGHHGRVAVHFARALRGKNSHVDALGRCSSWQVLFPHPLHGGELSLMHLGARRYQVGSDGKSSIMHSSRNPTLPGTTLPGWQRWGKLDCGCFWELDVVKVAAMDALVRYAGKNRTAWWQQYFRPFQPTNMACIPPRPCPTGPGEIAFFS